MSSNEVLDFESFCSMLNQLENEVSCDRKKSIALVNSIPIDRRVRLLLNVLSSRKPHAFKIKASTMLKALFSDWLNQNDTLPTLIDESKDYIIYLITFEENVVLQEELIFLFVHLAEVINKNRENKWELMAELVLSYGDKYQTGQTDTIQQLLVDNPCLFGKNSKQQLVQYRKLLMAVFNECSNKPQVVFFALNLFLNLLSCSDQSKFFNNQFSKLIPPLMEVMENIIVTSDASNFMKNLHHLLEHNKQIFKKHLRRITRKLIGILNNTNIESSVVADIFYWFEMIIVDSPEYIELKLKNYLPAIFDTLINFQVNCYPDMSRESFSNYDKCEEVRLSGEASYVYPWFDVIVRTLSIRTVYPLLNGKISELLRSYRWKRNLVALHLLKTILCIARSGPGFHPDEMFRTLKYYLSDDNPLIACQAIETTEDLCYSFPEQDYGFLHGDAKYLVVECASNHQSLNVKLQGTKSFGGISREWCLNDDEMDFESVAKLFLGLFAGFAEIRDPDLLKTLIEVFADNIGYAYELFDDKLEPYMPELIIHLLILLDKIILYPNFNKLIERVLFQICEAVFNEFSGKFERFKASVLNYVDGLSFVHTFCPGELEVPSCLLFIHVRFFPIISPSFNSLLPAIANSIVKYFSSINNFVSKLTEDEKYDVFMKRTRFGCTECFSFECDGGINLMSKIFVRLIENYDFNFYEYVEKCLRITSEILFKLGTLCHYPQITDGVHLLLRGATVYKKADGAKIIWRCCLKNTIIQIMKDGSNNKIFQMLCSFTKCITQPNFEDALNRKDFCRIGEYFEDIIDKVLKSTEISSQYDLNYLNEFIEPPLGETQYFHDTPLDAIRIFVRNVLPVYKEHTTLAVFPFLSSILKNKLSKRSVIIITFTYDVINDLLIFLSPSENNLEDLLPLILDFSFYLLTNYCGRKFTQRVLESIIKMKDAFPTQYDKHFFALKSTAKECIEQLLQQNSRPHVL